jgi:UDP-N-acetylbacillosamine N-acetyltransferase
MARADEKILGFPVLPETAESCGPFFLAIGDNQKRKILWDEWREKNLSSIVSSSALICPHAQIGRNVFVGNLAHIGPEVRIGHNTIINTGAIVEHEVVIGDHCHIGPRAVISGRSKIGSLTFIGVGAVVKDSINISSNIVVGAGAVVVKDLTEPGVYVGCPARRSSF